MKAIRITIIFYMISAAWYPLYSETNLIKNGSFETGKNGQADGWKSVTEINGVARGIIELSDKGFFKEGKFSLHMQSVNTSPGKDRISISCSRYLSASPDTYLPGKPFVLEFYAKSPVLNQTISLSYYTPSRWQPHWRKSKEFTLSDQWQKYAMSVIIPDAAFWQDRVLTFFIYLGYGEIFLDNVSARMEQEYGNTDSTPQDKSLIPGSDEEYHALLGKNLILNSGAERGWYQVFCQPANFGSAYEQFSNTGLVLEPNGYQGGACFSFYGTEKPIDNNNLQLSPIFLKANKKYFLSGYARSDRDNAEMIISFIQQSGTAYIKKVKLATAWRRYDMLIDNCGSKTQSDSQVKCHRDMGSGPETEGAYLAIPKFTGITPGARYFLDNIVGGYGLAVPEFKKEKILIRDRLASDRSQFIPGEKITIPLEFENPGAEMAEILMRYSITDFFGNELAAADIPITAVPAGKTAQYILATAVQKWGVFNLTITVKTSNDLIRHVIRLNTLTRPKKLMPEICIDLQLPFGTMKILDITQYCRKLLRDYVSAFGAGMVRLWLRDSRENENGYDQADREAIIALQEAHALGIKNYYCWSNPRNHWDKEFFDDINNRHLVPADLTEYTNMLTRRYQKYNGLIDYFELLNEPNIWVGKAKKPFPQGYQEINPEYYAALAKTTYKVLKKINPELPIIGPTTAGLDLGFIEDVLRQGTAKYLNGISYHGYPHLKRGNYTGDAENLKTILQRNNGEHLLTNIFQSEAGIQAETITREWEISRLQISMACKIPQMILLGLGEQQKSYNIFRISPLQTMGIEHALLLIGGPQTKNDYLAAPVLFSLRALNERLAGTVFNRKIVINPDIHCLIFNDETASKTICTLWMDDAITGTISMELPESNGLILYDLMGNLRPLSNRTIFLDHVPVYIETKYPPQILEKKIETAELRGIGNPYSLNISVVSQNEVQALIRSKSRDSVSGTITAEAIKPAAAMIPSSISFNGLKLGNEKMLKFKTVSPIDMTGQKIVFKALFTENENFLIQESELKAILTHYIKKGSIRIDAAFSDWQTIDSYCLDIHNTNSRGYTGPAFDWNKFIVKFKCAWDESRLYFSVIVKDDIHFNAASKDDLIWQGDSIQLAFDTLNTGTIGWDADDNQHGFALVNGKPVSYCWKATSSKFDAIPGKEKGPAPDIELAISRNETEKLTLYEFAYPFARYSPFRLQEGSIMRICLVVNNNNGDGRIGWLETSKGLGGNPGPADFIKFILVK